MSPFSLASQNARTSLLLALFLALLMLLALLFITFKSKRQGLWRFINAGLFLGYFVLLLTLCAEHNSIADGVQPVFRSAVPIWKLWFAAVALMLYATGGSIVSLRRRAHTIGRGSIKEALDTLPAGVCYFTEKGMVKLCNLQMYRLFYAISQRDLRSLEELHRALDGCDPHTGVVKAAGSGPVYLFPNGKAWLFTEGKVRLGDGSGCTEAIFYDVTELYEKRLEMEAQTNELRELGRSIRKLSENVAAATKEEEMLSFKTALHDRMGAGLVAARQALLQNRPPEELDALIRDWKRSVSLLKQDNAAPPDRGELPELMRDAEAIGVHIRIDGELPPAGDALDVFLGALRECLTNCVRHADGTALFARVLADSDTDTIIVTNNGKPPREEIVPCGGLSNLTRRAAYLGGTLRLQSLPEFMLTIAIPKNRGSLQ